MVGGQFAPREEEARDGLFNPDLAKRGRGSLLKNSQGFTNGRPHRISKTLLSLYYTHFL
jgi:hypothetical protein